MTNKKFLSVIEAAYGHNIESACKKMLDLNPKADHKEVIFQALISSAPDEYKKYPKLSSRTFRGKVVGGR